MLKFSREVEFLEVKGKGRETSPRAKGQNDNKALQVTTGVSPSVKTPVCLGSGLVETA